MSDACGIGEPIETLKMDWSYSPQVSRQHYMTSLNLESGGEKKKRTTENHMVPPSGSRRQRNWIHLETVGENEPGQECLEESCWRSIPQKRANERFDRLVFIFILGGRCYRIFFLFLSLCLSVCMSAGICIVAKWCEIGL